MGMNGFILLGGFAAIAIFGYYIMARLDHFSDKIRRENEKYGKTTLNTVGESAIALKKGKETVAVLEKPRNNCE